MIGYLRRVRVDSAETVFLIRTIFYTWPLFIAATVFLAYFLLDQGRISHTLFWVIAFTGIPVGLGFSFLTWWMLGISSRGFVRLLLAAGNIPPAPSFSLEESLIARGEFEAARATLEARLTGGPEDTAVRLRLAELHTRHLRQPAEAIRWLQEARRGPCDDRQQAAVANGLIDLYRATGERGRLMVELARFAELYPNTRAAANARSELRQLKTESP